MSQSPLRYKKLLQELPKHKHAKDALLASGFAPSTADKSSKRVLAKALQYQAKDILDNNDTTKRSKALMSEIIGLSREDLFNRLLYMALGQDKDLATALKILAPLAKEHGIVLKEDEAQKVIVPVLNITMDNEKEAINKDIIEVIPRND